MISAKQKNLKKKVLFRKFGYNYFINTYNLIFKLWNT